MGLEIKFLTSWETLNFGWVQVSRKGRPSVQQNLKSGRFLTQNRTSKFSGIDPEYPWKLYKICTHFLKRLYETFLNFFPTKEIAWKNIQQVPYLGLRRLPWSVTKKMVFHDFLEKYCFPQRIFYGKIFRTSFPTFSTIWWSYYIKKLI